MIAPALSALAGIGAAALWRLYDRGDMPALLLPLALSATAAWQAYIVDGYGAAHLAVGEGWAAAVVAVAAVAAAGLVAMRTNPRAAATWLAVGATALSLILPAGWSVGTASAGGNSGFPAARPPFLTEAAVLQRQRWALVAGALAGDPNLINFLRDWPRSMPGWRRRSSSRPAGRSSRSVASVAETRSSALRISRRSSPRAGCGLR